MATRVLIIGGAGFIGSHLADRLLTEGYEVRVFDNLEPQVHRAEEEPDYLSPQVEMVRGSVLEPEALGQALQDVDYVFHFAARVGVGQSMFRLADYTATNVLGTAHLLELLLDHPVKRLVVASACTSTEKGCTEERMAGWWRQPGALCRISWNADGTRWKKPALR